MTVGTNQFAFGDLIQNPITPPRPHVRNLNHFFTTDMVEVHSHTLERSSAIQTRRGFKSLEPFSKFADLGVRTRRSTGICTKPVAHAADQFTLSQFSLDSLTSVVGHLPDRETLTTLNVIELHAERREGSPAIQTRARLQGIREISERGA